MKPFIKIYVSETPGKITITEEEINELVDTAYKEGYSDGQREAKYFYEPKQGFYVNSHKYGPSNSTRNLEIEYDKIFTATTTAPPPNWQLHNSNSII